MPVAANSRVHRADALVHGSAPRRRDDLAAHGDVNSVGGIRPVARVGRALENAHVVGDAKAQ